jgi:hypothetical protein
LEESLEFFNLGREKKGGGDKFDTTARRTDIVNKECGGGSL